MHSQDLSSEKYIQSIKDAAEYDRWMFGDYDYQTDWLSVIANDVF